MHIIGKQYISNAKDVLIFWNINAENNSKAPQTTLFVKTDTIAIIDCIEVLKRNQSFKPNSFDNDYKKRDVVFFMD
jgi:hypothetical protein